MKRTGFIRLLLGGMLLSVYVQAQPAILQPGPHKVGFSQAVHYDLGRPPMREQTDPKGRAVHISTWYPASVKAGQERMLFGEYIDLVTQTVNTGPITADSRAEAIRLVKHFAGEIRADTALMARELPALMKQKTTAVVNAAYAGGEFPVVLYPEAPHLASIQAEYLASHGYIVVAISRHGTHDVGFEWQNARGIETLVRDGEFALAEVKKRFSLSDPPLAAMGVGMNASGGLAWMMRNPRVGALLSQEGGITTSYEAELVRQSPYFDVRKLTKPILVMHSPHEAVDPGLTDRYKYTDRHLLYLPRLSEFYYLNYGAWEQDMPGILGNRKPDVPASYRYMVEASRNFLDWQLKGLDSGKRFFGQVPGPIATYTPKKRFILPPLPAQLEVLEHEKGFTAMLDTVKRYLKDDPGAYTFDEFFAQGQRLVQAGRFKEALAWATSFASSFPNSATVQTMSGRSYLELGEKERALSCYREALKLLPVDPHLEEQQKEPLKAAIEQRIKQLTS